MISLNDKIKFIEKICGPGLLSRDNMNLYVSCPFCESGDRKKKLAIKTDDDKWHCWICGKKGINLVPIIKKKNPRLLKDYNHKSIEITAEDDDDEILLPEGFTLLSTGVKNADVSAVKRYCYSRGLSYQDFWRFRLGTSTKGKFRRRVIIPSYDELGNLNYYTGRAIDSDKIPKYYNAKVQRKNLIFNEINLNWKKPITLVEGPFDLMKCDWNSTCILGSDISEESKLFSKLVENKCCVYLGLDYDATKKTHKFSKLLTSYGCNVFIIPTKNIEDIGSISREKFIYLKNLSKKWDSNDRLRSIISSIKSGSIL